MLVEALHGEPPEDDGTDAVKTWVSTRNEFLQEGEKLQEIYTERQYGGYDFFPNCTRNAFEVATETLKDRMGSYGAEDQGVRAWLMTQDAVFENRGGAENKPVDLGAKVQNGSARTVNISSVQLFFIPWISTPRASALKKLPATVNLPGSKRLTIWWRERLCGRRVLRKLKLPKKNFPSERKGTCRCYSQRAASLPTLRNGCSASSNTGCDLKRESGNSPKFWRPRVATKICGGSD